MKKSLFEFIKDLYEKKVYLFVISSPYDHMPFHDQIRIKYCKNENTFWLVDYMNNYFLAIDIFSLKFDYWLKRDSEFLLCSKKDKEYRYRFAVFKKSKPYVL